MRFSPHIKKNAQFLYMMMMMTMMMMNNQISGDSLVVTFTLHLFPKFNIPHPPPYICVELHVYSLLLLSLFAQRHIIRGGVCVFLHVLDYRSKEVLLRDIFITRRFISLLKTRHVTRLKHDSFIRLLSYYIHAIARVFHI